MKMGIERCLKAAFGEQLVEVLQVGLGWAEMRRLAWQYKPVINRRGGRAENQQM